jgi:hypothetical protein
MIKWWHYKECELTLMNEDGSFRLKMPRYLFCVYHKSSKLVIVIDVRYSSKTIAKRPIHAASSMYFARS